MPNNTENLKSDVPEVLPMAQISCRLRELMEEKGRKEARRITYREIRRVTGIALNTLSGLNQVPLPKMLGTSVLERLCAYFVCDPGDLLVVTFETSAQAEGESDERKKKRRR